MTIKNGEHLGAATICLANSAGMEITLCALGAGIMSIKLGDRDGIVREFTKLTPKGYGAGHNGVTVGRTSGRIANAEFTIDGRIARLDKNNFGVDCLHGGCDALRKRVFALECRCGDEYTDAIFTYFSPDGEGGFFGNVDISVTYRVYERENRFAILFHAVPDCKTLINLTNHVYLDVSGDLRESSTEHELYLNADRVGVLNERMLASGIIPVPETFDFRTSHKIGKYIASEDVQRYAGGYDHPFFLARTGLDTPACVLYSHLSGVRLTVSTTYPCVVLYTDNKADCQSVCLECQYPSDGIHSSPEHCGVCSPESPYDEAIEYKFSIDAE